MQYKKVIFICDYAANYGGNFLASLAKLSKKLKNNQVKVEYVFPTSAKYKNWEINLNDYNVSYLNLDNEQELRKYFKRNLVSKSIIHTHFLGAKQLLIIKRMVGTRSNVKIVRHEHMDLDPQGNKLKNILRKVSFRFIFRNMFFIGVSPSVYKRLCSIYGRRHSYLVENAISFNRLDKNGKNPFSTNSKKHLIIFGTDYKRKGTDIAIQALQNSKYNSNLELDIITHNVEEAKEYIRQDNETIPDNVKVLSTDNNVQDFYNNSLAFLSPSRHEAFGYAVVESAYCGTQVVASDVPGQDTLKKIPFIYWVKKENVNQLTEAIDSIYEKSDSERQKEAHINKEFIVQNYSLDAWVDKIIDIYNRI